MNASIRRLQTGDVLVVIDGATIERLESGLSFFLPTEDEAEQVGDLVEKYREDIAPSRGVWPARLWLARQTFSIACAGVRRRVLGVLHIRASR